MPTFEQQRNALVKIQHQRMEGGPGSGRKPSGGHLFWKPEPQPQDTRSDPQKLMDRYKRLRGRLSKIVANVDAGGTARHINPWDNSYGKKADKVTNHIRRAALRTAVAYRKKAGKYPWQPLAQETKLKKLKPRFGKSPFRPNLAEGQRQEIVKAFWERENQLREGGEGSGRYPRGSRLSPGDRQKVLVAASWHQKMADVNKASAGDFPKGSKQWKKVMKKAGKHLLVVRAAKGRLKEKDMKTNYDAQRKEVVKAFRQREARLVEYGVPGMKWGQRNLPTRLDKIRVPFGPGSHFFVSRKVDYADDRASALKTLAARAMKNMASAKTKVGKMRLKKLADVAGRHGDKMQKIVNKKVHKYGRGPERY